MATSTRPKVLTFGRLIYATEDTKQAVAPYADIVQYDSASPEEFSKDLETKYKGVEVIYNMNGKLDKDMISRLPPTVKAICHFGAGYDPVDVYAAYEKGIAVSHTPGAVDDATATTCVALIIMAMRQFTKAEKEARLGNWKKNLPLARDPENKVLGIVGMGGIGSVVARRMLGWNMKIIYYNRREISPKPDFPCEYKSSLDELLEEADVVSLHMPLSKETEKSFGKAQFDKMKKGAVLVNTARGGVIDEPALIDALESGKLYAAGLDVFPNEPHINPELFKFDNVTILPHMGTETTDSRHKMGMVVLQNVLNALKGEPLTNLVAEHKKLQAQKA